MIMVVNDNRGLSIPVICLTVDEKPRKTLTQENWADGNRTRIRWVRGNDAIIVIENSSFENVKKFKYLGVTGSNLGPPAWQARMLPPALQRWRNLVGIHVKLKYKNYL